MKELSKKGMPTIHRFLPVFRKSIVNGTVNGNIGNVSSVFVGAKGIIHGNLHVSKAIIQGEVEGDIFAKEQIFIQKDGKVTGNIWTKQLVMDPTATLLGMCNIAQNKKEA